MSDGEEEPMKAMDLTTKKSPRAVGIFDDMDPVVLEEVTNSALFVLVHLFFLLNFVYAVQREDATGERFAQSSVRQSYSNAMGTGSRENGSRVSHFYRTAH